MRLAVGGDHAGYDLKARFLDELPRWGHEIEHLGAHTPEPVDFPDIVVPVCDAVVAGRVDRGLLICGTGIGASIAANKLPGIRAALCHDVHSAHQAVEHDDANVLCLGAQIVGDRLALDLLKTYLAARMSPEEHFQRRIRQLAEMEREAAVELGTTRS